MTKTILLIETDHPAELDVYVEAFREHFPDVQIRTATSHAEAARLAPGAGAIVAKPGAIPPAAASAPSVEWIQALTTGVDRLWTLPIDPRVTITSMRGIHGPQMSELAILMMIALARRLPRMLRNQAERRWERWQQPILDGKTLAVVGLGAIAEALAQRTAALGMTNIGVSNGRAEAPGFERIYRYDRLGEAAALADFLVVLAPLSDATRHLVGADVIAAMKDSAFLINIARGPVIDETALEAALDAGKLAGAGLDVFETEPLPAGSSLWARDNVIVTPRIGGMSDRYAHQVLPTLLHNVAAWMAGETLSNRVDRPG